jgi:hypothetical protein
LGKIGFGRGDNDACSDLAIPHLTPLKTRPTVPSRINIGDFSNLTRPVGRVKPTAVQLSNHLVIASDWMQSGFSKTGV